VSLLTLCQQFPGAVWAQINSIPTRWSVSRPRQAQQALISLVALMPTLADSDIEALCFEALKKQGVPAKGAQFEVGILKGGYICATRRICVDLEDGADAKACPPTLIFKGVDANCNDHQIALDLKLYDREWHFYETMQPVLCDALRSPKYFGTVVSEGEKLGVLLEDLCIPGAVLCPKLDTDGILVTVEHCARMHAKFWNSTELETLGVQPHNGSWFNPSWTKFVQASWVTFAPKWADVLGDLLPLGEKLQKRFQWVQDEISKAPRTFLHGDVKPGNMFMLPDTNEEDKVPLRWQGMMPAYIDWQYTAIGKGCCDLVFFLEEGYPEEECAGLEPIVKAAYLESLQRNGVEGYSAADLDRDWQLASMYFPFYVSLWFGNVPDDKLVDPAFPKRIVPRCFAALARLKSVDIIPESSCSLA